MKKTILFLLCIYFSDFAKGQFFQVSGADTSNKDVSEAVAFLKTYLSEFNNRKYPDYKQYWSPADCAQAKCPDDMVHGITTDGATYRFGKNPTIFYVRPYKDYVHLKTLFSSLDTSGKVTVWAITNHYVSLHNTGKPYFISHMGLNKDAYQTVTNGDITYHFPRGNSFSKATSDSMLARLGVILKQWNFKAIPVHYYYANTQAELATMKGFDYVYGMDGVYPSGISDPKTGTIHCNGLGEGYLHEVLHLYFNPLYEESPVNHGLIYYLAGGLGKDFNWFIHRMNKYLLRYPDTDLSQFETLYTKDPMLHIDHTVKGLICKIVYEKEGVKGLKRLLAYKSSDEVLKKEFDLKLSEADKFLKQQFAKYDLAK